MCEKFKFLLIVASIVTVNCLVGDGENLEENLCEDTHETIQTDLGMVRGHKAKDGDYFAYLGIPYAEPPIGYYRFKAPLPAVPWSGVYDANRTVQCPQMGEGDENCLVLNVFTPTKTKSEKLPVLVYIHGGSLLISFGPTEGVEPLIKQNVVVVTINYRLGVLGFLCLRTEAAPGNAGLKDQIEALKWVQRNIEHFGGDPRRVTLYGMSAGAASVEMLVLSEKTKGLFQGAVIESGSALNVWAIDMKPITTANNLADLLYYTGDRDVDKLAQLFRSVPADLLSVVNTDYYQDLTDGLFGFVPCIEKTTEEEAVITEHPYTTMTKQKYRKVPMVVIFSTLEGLFLRSEEFHGLDYEHRMENNFEDFLPSNLVFRSNASKHDVALNIKHVYFGNAPVSIDTILGYLNYFGDTLVLRGLLDSAKLHSTQPDAPKNTVYLMEFAYSGGLGSTIPIDFLKNIKIAGHGDFIKHVILEKPIINEDDKTIVDRVSTLIANFVKFQNPIPSPTKLLPSLWPEVTVGHLPYLHLDKNITILDNPYSDRMLFWQKIYENHERHDIPMSPWTL